VWTLVPEEGVEPTPSYGRVEHPFGRNRCKGVPSSEVSAMVSCAATLRAEAEYPKVHEPGPPAQSRKTWNIPGAALIGVGGSFVFVLAADFFSPTIKPHGHVMTFSKYQAREATELISQVAAALVLAPVVLSIARRRCSEGFWASVGWNSRRLDVALSILCILFGGILAIAVSAALTARYGSAGSLRGPVDVTLYALSGVLVAPLIEETYFRGILFAALANRVGTLASILIVTIISSLVHLGHMLYVFPVMAVLGFMRLRTESVASCFVLHASYNLFAAVYILVVR
jgi:membrane protease YdiL (CAAX protease family)